MDSKPTIFYQANPEDITSTILIGVDKKIEDCFKKFKQSQEENEQLLTVEETLNLLKCSKQALWNWRKNGILPSYRLGNRVYYKKSDIFAKLVKQD
ncbi:helix-turn-helix domain-containing protein [Flavivirga spongiicola]|uniref:Helix-turn-helix domain-containing protein n=1 Tax=Flavivirga spongiicola TaxID=421621 RepID=A0ABU7XT90_9FLAO|nr:helix-turn-helix domain-containing protein [Flavivirga sp. MEBiC05379]MDO5978996.1 helix-turn-helix domain-containing protein [Flavivirga sp. MEBiC05379]